MLVYEPRLRVGFSKVVVFSLWEILDTEREEYRASAGTGFKIVVRPSGDVCGRIGLAFISRLSERRVRGLSELLCKQKCPILEHIPKAFSLRKFKRREPIGALENVCD